MGKQRSKDRPPSWNLLDNKDTSGDNYCFLYQSMILSDAYKGLTATQKAFLITILINCTDPNNKARISAYKQEENKRNGIDKNVDVRLWTDFKSGYFIFSEKEQKLYGYSKTHTSKLMKALIKSGFVECVRDSKYQTPGREKEDDTKTDYRLVNVYKMSGRWKTKENKE